MNPDDFKAALLARLGFTPAPRQEAPPASQRGQLLAAALGGEPASHDPQDRFRSLTGSPFADSLKSLIGSPAAFRYEDRGPEVLGEYAPGGGKDTVFVTPRALVDSRVGKPVSRGSMGRHAQPEYVLAHEMGHRLEQTHSGDPMQQAQDSIYDAQMQRAAPPSYWTTNSKEHYAEAFANAVTLLRATAAQHATFDTPERVAPVLAQYERTVPGTQRFVSALLATPLYAQHPLKQASQASMAPADATRLAAALAQRKP